MRKLFFIILLVFIPGLAYGSLASDFTVNNQPTYAMPPGSTRVLILDLTLPEALKSIKITNAGTARQTDISRILVFEDGSSAGWDGDEKELIIKSESPFWDTWHSGSFSQPRIFITMDITSTAISERTIKPQLQINSVEFISGAKGPADKEITGLERMILATASLPTTPVSPLAKSGEALATSTIRWHFIDLSNNEFGFKLLDKNLKELARQEQADISYLDETGLEPNTEYSGRKVIAFNDRGESLIYSFSGFAAVFTLAFTPAPQVQEKAAEAIVETVKEAPAEEVVEEQVVEKPMAEMTIEELKAKITEVQQKIIELLNQLIQLIQEQIAKLQK